MPNDHYHLMIRLEPEDYVVIKKYLNSEKLVGCHVEIEPKDEEAADVIVKVFHNVLYQIKYNKMQ